MKRLRILTLVSVLLAAAIFFFKKRTPTTIAAGEGLVLPVAWLQTDSNAVTPVKDRRPADQTFLTYPEWFLVFSPEEQAQYFRQHTATSFPFMQHTAQIWQSYGLVNNQIKDNFPVNKGYHFMIWVIGSSATAEYSIKAWYETVIGRITDTHTVITDEDRFNAKFTQEYVDFIKERPWYEFDFKSRLAELWNSSSFFGDHFLRKIERKYILTSELLVKAAYGKLIGLGTKTVYEEALPNTVVLAGAAGDSNVQQGKPGQPVLLSLPRYDRFNDSAVALAKRGIQFKEIAGNRSAILLTVLVPAESHINTDSAKTVFTQPLPAIPGTKRIALAIPVAGLSNLLKILDGQQVTIEHVFDY